MMSHQVLAMYSSTPMYMKIFSLSQVRLYLAEIRTDLLRNSLKNAETELIYHGKFKVKEF